MVYLQGLSASFAFELGTRKLRVSFIRDFNNSNGFLGLRGVFNESHARNAEENPKEKSH